MIICDHSRMCDNKQCSHKEKHVYDLYRGCNMDYCSRYKNKKIYCIEVLIVP